MCEPDADGEGEKKAGSVVATKMPYHEWVILQARLYELDRRDDLAIDGTIDPLTAGEQAELVRLKKKVESKDETTYVLMHHCEAIASGVTVPEDHQEAVRNAILAAYCVFKLDSEYLDARHAVEAALVTLGVSASELPFIVGSTEWKAALASIGVTEDGEEEDFAGTAVEEEEEVEDDADVEAGAGLNIDPEDNVEEDPDDE